jgi:probable methyltransferase, YaeB/AF_0241 family
MYKKDLFLPNILRIFAAMNIKPVAYFHSPLTSKFGIPRQSGLAQSLQGRIVFEREYRHAEAVRGLEQFDYLWLIWEFSANDEGVGLTVRPPRLGGNERVGVFASRSPFRPNRLGLSCVRINKVEMSATEGPVIHVSGADLMDGTPIYDVKPYVAYADSHPEARSGFVDQHQWQPLCVEIPDDVVRLFSDDELQALREVLAQDPRPRFHDDPDRIYGMPFANRDVKFRVSDGTLFVIKA